MYIHARAAIGCSSIGMGGSRTRNRSISNPSRRKASARLSSSPMGAHPSPPVGMETCITPATGPEVTSTRPAAVADCNEDLPPNWRAPGFRGLDVATNGTVYAAATGCRCVVKITSAGKVTTVLKSERPWNPTGVALRHAWTSGLVFLRTKRAAEQRANSQHGKEINGNFRQTEQFRFSATEERGLTATVRGHLFEGTGL